MTAPALACFVVAGVSAIVDWYAVGRANRPIELIAKPATTVALVLAALAIHPEFTDRRWWFVAALMLSLKGDVLLMLGEDLFVLGLAAFLLAHLAYIGGFLVASHGSSATGGVFSSVFVPVTALTLGFRIARQLLAGPHRELFVPVVAYMVVIAGMVGAACATGNVVAAAAAVTFYASDATIAEQRFVQARRWQPVAIMVTYHVAQTLFVLSLLR